MSLVVEFSIILTNLLWNAYYNSINNQVRGNILKNQRLPSNYQIWAEWCTKPCRSTTWHHKTCMFKSRPENHERLLSGCLNRGGPGSPIFVTFQNWQTNSHTLCSQRPSRLMLVRVWHSSAFLPDAWIGFTAESHRSDQILTVAYVLREELRI